MHKCAMQLYRKSPTSYTTEYVAIAKALRTLDLDMVVKVKRKFEIVYMFISYVRKG